METWESSWMSSSTSSAHMVGVKRSILDTVVVQQQKRIQELEEKLRRASKKLRSMRKEAQADTMNMAPPVASKEDKSISKVATPQVPDGVKSTKMDTSTPKMVNTKRMSTTTNSINMQKCKSLPISSPQLGLLPRYWTEEEHRKFLEGRKLYGPKNYAAISDLVRTRTPKQVRTHAQKYEMRLVRESAMMSYAISRQVPQQQQQQQLQQQTQMHCTPQPTQLTPQLAAQQAPPLAQPQSAPPASVPEPSSVAETTVQPIKQESCEMKPQLYVPTSAGSSASIPTVGTEVTEEESKTLSSVEDIDFDESGSWLDDPICPSMEPLDTPIMSDTFDKLDCSEETFPSEFGDC